MQNMHAEMPVSIWFYNWQNICLRGSGSESIWYKTFKIFKLDLVILRSGKMFQQILAFTNHNNYSRTS